MTLLDSQDFNELTKNYECYSGGLYHSIDERHDFICLCPIDWLSNGDFSSEEDYREIGIPQSIKFTLSDCWSSILPSSTLVKEVGRGVNHVVYQCKFSSGKGFG